MQKSKKNGNSSYEEEWQFFPSFFLTRFLEVEPTLQCKKYARFPSCFPGRGGGGGNTPIHYLYQCIRVCAAEERGRDFRTGYPFQRRLLERGIISNAQKLQFCKQPFEIIQGQIAFKNRVRSHGLRIRFNALNKQTVVLFLHPRTEYKKNGPFPDGVSVLGRILEQGIKNWPISRIG